MERKYSTFWPRFCAGFIDGLVFLPLIFLTNYIYDSHQTLAIVLWFIVNTFICYAYGIFFHGKFGQTLGKMAMKVKLMDISETRIVSYKQAFLRESVPIGLAVMLLPWDIIHILNGTSYIFHSEMVYKDTISLISIYAIAGWGLLEVVTMLFSSKRRAIHDFIAGSVVVRV